MRLIVPIACLLTSVSLAATVVVTALPDTPGFTFYETGTMPNPDEGTTLSALPAFDIEAGGMDLHFDLLDGTGGPGVTALRSIEGILGGNTQYFAAKEQYLWWLCYTQPAIGAVPATLVWFRSSAYSGGYLENVVVEVAPDTIPAGCVASKRPLDLTTGLPGIGAKASEVTAKIGAAEPVDGKLIYKKHLSHQDLGLDFVLIYKIENGVVTIFSIDQAGTG